jgi:hypothetical protein
VHQPRWSSRQADRRDVAEGYAFCTVGRIGSNNCDRPNEPSPATPSISATTAEDDFAYASWQPMHPSSRILNHTKPVAAVHDQAKQSWSRRVRRRASITDRNFAGLPSVRLNLHPRGEDSSFLKETNPDVPDPRTCAIPPARSPWESRGWWPYRSCFTVAEAAPRTLMSAPTGGEQVAAELDFDPVAIMR